MPKFFHELADAKGLFEALAGEKNVSTAIVEKDYWVMHCLWGLTQGGFRFELKGGTSLWRGWNIINRFSEDIDIRFEPPKTLNVRDEKKPGNVKARFAFFDELAAQIRITGIEVERNRSHDHPKATSAGINLNYVSHFPPDPALKSEVLLELGFHQTAPNEDRNFTSWTLEKALAVGLDVIDNRAKGVKCFNPEYTFVDKLQTICRYYRQYRDGKDGEKPLPRKFLRHYYDFYMLLGVDRVVGFIGSKGYEEYKALKLRGEDAREFASREAFTLLDPKTFALFKDEFRSMGRLLLSAGPTFENVMGRLREYSPRF